MTTISNPSAPGYPSPVVAEQPVRSVGGIPMRGHNSPDAISPPVGAGAQISTIPSAAIDAHGGKLIRR